MYNFIVRYSSNTFPKPFHFNATVKSQASDTGSHPVYNATWKRQRKSLLIESANKSRETEVCGPNPKQLPNPRDIKAYLDQWIIGQEELKITLSVTIYNHYQRIQINSSKIGHPIEKSNILLFGSTGSGKTLTAKTIAQLLHVPFSMNDATCFTQAGYVGEDVESCVSRLLQSCQYDVEQAQKGIVFIDEIDKICRRSDQANPNQRDVGGEGVQQGLLRMLEGTTVYVNVKPGTMVGKRLAQPGESFAVDTSNILFICSGAFQGLDRIVKDRLNTKSLIGFESVSQDVYQTFEKYALEYAEPEDLVNYGFIPEFVGRLPSFAFTRPLTEYDMYRILVEPKNALLSQYQRLFLNSQINLVFSDRAIKQIAETASKRQTGARGLRRIMESLLKQPLYDFAHSSVRRIEITGLGEPVVVL